MPDVSDEIAHKRRRRKDLPSQERLKRLFSYDSATGDLTWKSRDDVKNPGWNTKFAGRIAGTVQHRGYRRIAIDNKAFWAHRLVWVWLYGTIPDEIDHANGNPGDNRANNLRNASRLENCRNTGKKRNKSGYKGVKWIPWSEKWQARIKVGKKEEYLGLFNTREAAAQAYEQAAKHHFGIFYRQPDH